jgi:hypothetical protein
VLYGIGSLASQIAAPRACPPPDATIERLRELVVQQGASERFAQRDAIGAALLIFSEAFPCR